ncbi:hypothetical protein, partial [Rubrivirga sp.]|uniref:hypothetical protein n=1 Tax=Rubrivirga sp. TaxID=1885344 RepID=UPI003C7646A9
MTLRTALAAALLTALATPALAQSPVGEQIPYQGRLTDAAGAPLADGTQTIRFVLEDAAGSSWAETATVQTVGGVFTHYLGSVTEIAGVDFADAPSLSLILNPDGAATVFGPVPLGAVPAAYRALEGGGSLTFPFTGTASTQLFEASFTLSNTGSGDGLRIEAAGDDGVEILAAGGDGIAVEAAGNIGVYVDEATSHGVAVQSSMATAFVAASAAGAGLAVFEAGTDGVSIGTVGRDGVHVFEAEENGFYVNEAKFQGLQVNYAGGRGLYIYRSGDTDADDVPDADRDGVLVDWAGGDGVEVARANFFGVRASGEAGNYLRNTRVSVFAPDLILGGTGTTDFNGDDGVLQSDFRFTSSDLSFRSNDAVQVFLDANDDEAGDFSVVNGAGNVVFGVNEAGTQFLTGTTQSAEAAIYLDDPSAPDARTLTLPSVVSSDRLVAFSGTAQLDGDGAAIVQLPDYAAALVGDFRYQLTAVGAAMPSLHVARTVEGGAFAVGGGTPGASVSWRVEGVRQDAWAVANA